MSEKIKHRNSKKIREFIHENSTLFWYIRDDEKENISEELLVETILNWGNLEDAGRLIRLLGIKNVANIFYKNTSGKRTNYRKHAINYFNLYFERHSHKNTDKAAGGIAAARKTFF